MTETDRVMNDLMLLSQAWNFAARRHASQRRKGEAQEPYINHLTEVAELVALATNGRDVNLVVAAALHDTVEDTDTEPGEIASTFNDDIAALVSEVTDDKRLDKSERKRMQVVHASAKSGRAKILKLADKTSNLRSLTHSPPVEWSIERKREYLSWARAVAQGLRGANPWLEQVFDDAANELEATLT